ncbi:transcriptional regulator, HxlR family [Pseudonocardia oroxyli]|uniref:Transcriptional regulator, HxlR family n=1 Tax=Pseudonocardia oroxyli TaxID=366584 RepID=A0A1G7E3B6_PSEOR|nr:transcriptional regulator, HxlR family [Pseudonocardia oroxyli]
MIGPVSTRLGTVFLADCPTRLTLEVITGKWAVIVLFALRHGPVRHGELVDRVGGVSRKVLTQTLRRLQDNGLVERHVHAEAPPRVEYGLTELGRTLEEPIRMLTDWAVRHGEAVVDRQQEAARHPGRHGRAPEGAAS